MSLDQILVYFVVLAASFGLCVVLQPLAKKTGLIDIPDKRKVHSSAVPLVGGIAIFIAFLVGTLIRDPSLYGYQHFFVASALLVVVGAIDDKHALPVWFRFATQIAAVLLVAIWIDLKLYDLGDLLFVGNIELGLLAVPFTVFAVVGVINALNMSDGVDGLVGGYSLITLGSLIFLAWDSSWLAERSMLLLLMTAITGFMLLNARSPWNKRARIFMGDAGSMFLGFALACALIKFSQGEGRLMAPVTALWLFALPLMDTVASMVRRMKKRQSPFMPDHEHFHHILQRSGFTVGQSVMIMWGLASVLAIVGIAGYRLGIHDGIMFLAFLGLFFLYYWMINRAWRVMQFLHRPIAHKLHTK